MGDKIKVLMCGDVEGRFNTFFKKIENLNKKSGPFDLVICVGNFFGINNVEFEPYKSGLKKISIPICILGPNTEDHLKKYPENNVELCENLQYLGKRGLYISSTGLKIAYLSGISTTEGKTKNEYEYNSEEVIALRDICMRGNANFKGVDILLTAQWPEGVMNKDPKWNESNSINSSSLNCAWLSGQIRPRYHVSGISGVFYERAPYRAPNPDLEITTRFVGLARVGNAEKEKWLYAVSLMPIEKMKIPELLQKTTDETQCPFDMEELDAKVLKKRKVVSGNKQQFFYDMNAPNEKNDRNKRQKKQKVEFDQSKCWFCLASPSVEKHLIITVGNSVYLALAKGGLVEEHFLICPIEHYQCSIGQPDEVLQEVEKFKHALTSFYGRNSKVPIFFERNFKTSHMQIQAVPMPRNCTKELQEIFKDEGEAHGVFLQELESHSRLEQVLPAKVPYFTVQLPDDTILYTKIQGNKGFPINFAREVLTTGPILNMPDRIEWKDCILNKEEETRLVERIRNDFEPFDFTED